MATSVGSTVSHYKILEHLGGGGMGVVYKAEDTSLKRTVALKFLPPELTRDPEAIERFIHEAQAASALDHANICSVHEIGEHDGQTFMVMGYYEGETLKKKIERGPLSIDQSIDIARQIAEGLSRAHEAGIIHRDIKPANIMVTGRGEVKIVDFGLAKLSGRTLLTKTGTTMGTAAYMSPEQARGEVVDARTDIWSLGVVLYEMLTGKKPFESDYEQALVYSILNEEPKPVRSIRPEVPESLGKVFRRATWKNPGERYQTAAELVADLEAFRAGSKLATRTERLPAKKRKLLLLAGTVAVILVAVGLTLFLPQGTPRITSLAVLPFVNVSKIDSLDYVCDALTDEVTQQLSQVLKSQKVIAYSAVMRYKNRQDIVPSSVAETLGVDALVMTRMHQAGGELIFDIEMVSARDNTSLWEEKIRRDHKRLSAIPRTLSSAILGSLGFGNLDEPKQKRQGSEDAYKLLLLGRHSYHKLFEPDIRRAMAYYREAIDLDPAFARAYVGIVECYSQLALFHVPWAQVKDSALAMAQEAMKLDSNLAEAHHGMALFRYFNFEQKAAEPEFIRAITLNPSYAEAIHNYAHFLAERRAGDKAITLMQRSVDLEPTSQHYLFCLGLAYKQCERQEGALEIFSQVRALDSTSLFGELALEHLAQGNIYLGKFDQALVYVGALDRLGKGNGYFVPLAASLRACTYAAMGRKAEALRLIGTLHELASSADFDPFYLAMPYAYLGERQQAIDWLEVAYSRASTRSYYMYVEKAFESLSSEPRYKDLVRRAGYTE